MRFEQVDVLRDSFGVATIKYITVYDCGACRLTHEALRFDLQTSGGYLAACPETQHFIELGTIKREQMSISIETALMNAARRGLEANVEVSGKEHFSVWVYNAKTDSTVMHDITNIVDAPRLIDKAVEFLTPEEASCANS